MAHKCKIAKASRTSEGRAVQGESLGVTWSSRRCRDSTRCRLHFPTVQHWEDASYLQQDSRAVHVTRSHCHFVFTNLPREDTTEVLGDTITSVILCQICSFMDLSITHCLSISSVLLVPAWDPLCKWTTVWNFSGHNTAMVQTSFKLSPTENLFYLSFSVQRPYNLWQIPVVLVSLCLK